MADKPVKEIAIVAISGIVGVMVGAVSTGVVNNYTLRRQQQKQAVMDAYKFDFGQYPQEFYDVKIFVDQSRNLSIESPEEVATLADITRRHPECTGMVGKNCLAAVVEGIQAARKEFGAGQARSEDLETVIRPSFEKARRAVKSLNE